MINRGFKNVKMVHGGGEALEKFFDHYTKTYYGGKIISPATGKEFDVKP
jgi:hypothetical protein